MSIVIRNATPDDVPAILALFNHHVRETTAIWRDKEVDLTDRMAWFDDRQRQGFPVLVAEEMGAFLGFASYGPFRTGSGYDGTVENSVYVSVAAQGRGIASRLMRALIDHGRAAGRTVMVAGIGLPNDASVALHLKLGFIETGRLRGIGLKYSRRLNLLLMQREL